MFFKIPQRYAAWTIVTTCLAALATPGSAMAHVKWFQPYDLSLPPTPFSDYAQATLWLLCAGLSFPALWLCMGMDRLQLALRLPALLRERIDQWESKVDDLMRLAVGIWLSWLWLQPNPVWLTPELTTQSTSLPWLQLLLGLACISRKTTWITAIGLLSLFIGAVGEYGIFHLMDYPLFLGISAFLIAISLNSFGIVGINWVYAHRLGILALAMAWTLMWASVEKWGYASWSLPILRAYPHITMGIPADAFLIFAGWLEFGAAAMLIMGGKASSRAAAIVLTFIFLSAIADFGQRDLVGHMPIIVGLMIIAVFGNGRLGHTISMSGHPLLTRAIAIPGLYFGLLILFSLSYTQGWYLAYQGCLQFNGKPLPANSIISVLAIGLVCGVAATYLVNHARRRCLATALGSRPDPR